MYRQDYLFFAVALLVCVAFAVYANGKVKRAYREYGAVANRRGITGRMAASRLLQGNNLYNVGVGKVQGYLSDHYDPRNENVNLSEDVYESASVASVAIAAHEIGHVMQKQSGYGLYRVRTALVPIVNLGSRLAMPLVLIGMLLEIFVLAGSESTLGYTLAMVGVLLYASTLLFALVTLPVELDASRRASQMLVSHGILAQDEMRGAKKVLSAAAMTYLASALISLVYFMRFLIYVLTVFGRRDD